jgi:hypothetical protein
MDFYPAQNGYLHPAMSGYGSSWVGMVIGFPKVIFNSVATTTFESTQAESKAG